MHMQASTGHKIFVQSIKTDVSSLISTASLIVEDRLAISLSGCLSETSWPTAVDTNKNRVVDW
jgi:hypothetical protein